MGRYTRAAGSNLQEAEMKANYRAFFGLKKEPFGADIPIKEIMQTQALAGVCDRFEYAVRLGAMAVVTGEIGSGKSTALRYAVSKLHPSEYRWFYVTGTSGSILELYRQLMAMLGTETASNSRAVMLGRIKKEIRRLVTDKKIKVVLIIDEASLLRLEVFTELHALLQFEQDAKPWLPGGLRMYDMEDEWEYGEKRAQVQAMLEELVLDAIIDVLTKIKQRNEWVNQSAEKTRDEMQF